jgi:D-alanyl-D-alanine carboxypeptidase/D-alanyl-D-alanine-endopeptidase (penicillin-binding protein 4)
VFRTVGVVFIVAALATVAVVVRDADDSARTTKTETIAGGAATTPLWSPRRVPAMITALATRQKYGGIIAGFAAEGRCVAVDGPAGPLARVGTATAYAPASTEKLLTGAAALQVLGPAHVFTTTLETTATISGGVLHGDLYLVGGGDPVLATPPFRQRLAASPLTAAEPTTPLDDLAAAVTAAGIHGVDGSIVADDSHGDTLRYLPSLKPSERGTDIGPLGALTVDDGFTASGTAASDPALLTATSLDALLGDHGVTVSGVSRRGAAPGAAHTVGSVTSPQLDAIVASMLTVSDNYTAEMLVRAVGLAVSGTGSSAAGLRDVVGGLARLGVPTAGVSLVDGSGLSPQDRVTCPALLAAVELGDRAQERALRVGLPIAGRTGTLAARFIGDPLAGRLRAKTGHIDGVVGLAGIVPTAAGTVSFAFLANGDFSVSGGDALQDQIAHLVAEYPGVPDAAHLVPAPTA